MLHLYGDEFQPSAFHHSAVGIGDISIFRIQEPTQLLDHNKNVSPLPFSTRLKPSAKGPVQFVYVKHDQ